jgi:hypothetical protein
LLFEPRFILAALPGRTTSESRQVRAEKSGQGLDDCSERPYCHGIE